MTVTEKQSCFVKLQAIVCLLNMSSLITCIVSFLCNVNVAFLSAEAQRKEFFGSKCVFIAFLFVLCKVVKMETSPSKRQPLAPASPGGRRFPEGGGSRSRDAQGRPAAARAGLGPWKLPRGICRLFCFVVMAEKNAKELFALNRLSC